MKVVHLSTTTAGGAGIALTRIHSCLRLESMDSRIVCSYTKERGSSTVSETKRASLGIVGRILAKAPYFRFEDKLQKDFREVSASCEYELFSFPFSDRIPEDHKWLIEADVVTLHWVAGVIDWRRFFKRNVKPLVWVLHDQQPYLGGFHYEFDRDGCPALKDVERQIVKYKKQQIKDQRFLVVGNSNWNTNRAIDSTFFPKATVFETIYYPIDYTKFVPINKIFCKHALGFSRDQIVIGFACEDLSNKRKGFETLLRTLRKLPKDVIRNLGLLSFGRTPPDSFSAGLPVTWSHLGELSSPIVQSSAYSAMDCFVIPSFAEAFGQTALESLACEVPVIGSRVGGIPEIVIEGETGFTFAAGNESELASQLLRVIENEELREEMGRKGRKLVIARHDPSSIASRFRSLYMSVSS